MKRLFVTFILGIVLLLNVNASDLNDLNALNIDKLILNKIKSFGINILDINFEELEPDELIYYDDYSKKDISSQKTDFTAWSTIRHNNLDKLDIVTKSSSTLKGYPVTNLFDKKTDTPWVEGIKGDGIGEWISIKLSPKKLNYPFGLSCIGIIPGYLKSDKTWEENIRIKTALLIIENLGYNGMDYIFRLNFEDFKGLQIFNIGKYAGYDKKIWIIYEDIYKGTKYTDTCISEIVINGAVSPSAVDGP